jgi:hypothetical protein
MTPYGSAPAMPPPVTAAAAALRASCGCEQWCTPSFATTHCLDCSKCGGCAHLHCERLLSPRPPPAPPAMPPGSYAPPPPWASQLLAAPSPGVGRYHVRDVLNQRYRDGRTSNDLASAGVLVHIFDGGLNPQWPWSPGGYGHDYLSASILNARPRLGGGSTAKDSPVLHNGMAVVVSPTSRLRCAYPQDGNTNNWYWPKVPLGGCGPRLCTPRDLRHLWTCDHARSLPCALPPSMFANMQQIFEARDDTIGACAYTEVIIAIDGLAFDAFVGVPEETHRAALRFFGLNAHQLPNLQFADLRQGGNAGGMLFV